MDPYFKGKADLPERFLRDQLLFLLQGLMLEKELEDPLLLQDRTLHPH